MIKKCRITLKKHLNIKSPYCMNVGKFNEYSFKSVINSPLTKNSYNAIILSDKDKIHHNYF